MDAALGADLHQIVGHDRLAPAHVDQDCAGLHPAEPALVHQTVGLRPGGQGEGDDVRPGQKLVQLRKTVQLVEVVGLLPELPADADGIGAEGLAFPGELAADIAHAHGKHHSVFQRGNRSLVAPEALPLVVVVGVEPLEDSQHHAEHMLGNGKAVGPAGVGQNGSLRHARREAVCPGGGKLQQLQPLAGRQKGMGQIADDHVRPGDGSFAERLLRKIG